jgi:ankyrin repeat protein
LICIFYGQEERMGRFFEMLPVLIPTSFDQQAFTYFQVDSRSNKTIEQMVDEENTDIHIAATLNHADATHRILSNHVQWLEERDENGDQPAHIAARLGNIQTLRVLIEFDAPMETRNYNLLTPIGEARINQQFEAIHLLRENYIFRSFDGIERYVYRRIHPSAIPSQTVARATTRRLRY